MDDYASSRFDIYPLVALRGSFRTLPSVLTLVVAACFVLYFAGSCIYRAYFHPLAKWPGPRLWAVSRLPWLRQMLVGTLWQTLDELHAQYGPVVRIAPDELSMISAAAWRDVYGDPRPALPKDPYSMTPPLNGAHSLFTAEGATHRRIRGAYINGFSDKALREQAIIIEGHASKLMSRLRTEVRLARERGEDAINIQRYYGYESFDVISDLALGEPLHGLEPGADHEEIQGFFLHCKFSTVRNSLSRFPPLDAILTYAFFSLTAKRRKQNWMNITSKVDRRLARGDLTGVRTDFLSPVIGKVREDTSKNGISKAELLTNEVAVTIANCQLATVALTTATYCLARNPQTFARLSREVRAAGFTSEADITVESTQSLTYLNAVISETLRIHHPTPISLPRVLPEDRIIDGEVIPKNTVVSINVQNIQNTPLHWHEPRKFHPERFLPESSEYYDPAFERDNKAAYQPFSAGPRNCIGGKVFLAQARVILARFAYNFDVQLADVDDYAWLDQKAYLVFEPKALRVRLEERHEQKA